MNLFFLLVLIGLASIGVVVVIVLLAVVDYAIFLSLVFLIVCAIIAVGMIGDYLYDKKMLRNDRIVCRGISAGKDGV